ncbi:MAG: hypothetical protein KF912_02790 [Phycisphaeraceae bacterium]|nr:hypothetical protein [Phycisphaeraceae bacterium]MBX3366227.1 hypothetical protein [Phycisphaeraceae bacterium]
MSAGPIIRSALATARTNTPRIVLCLLWFVLVLVLWVIRAGYCVRAHDRPMRPGRPCGLARGGGLG